MGLTRTVQIVNPSGPGGELVDLNVETAGTLGAERIGAGITGQTAGENITQGDPVFLDAADSKWRRSRADTAVTLPARGVAKTTVLANSTFDIITDQQAAGYTFTAPDKNKNVFIGVTGGVTLTPPSASGQKIQRVGFVFSTTQIQVDLGEVISIP